jgi:ADP-heptose:LPS heptosyltransferase
MYFGYDSAGQHAAAALGIPLVTVFQGFVNERFLQRWTPAGAGLVRVVRADRPGLLRRTADTVNQLFAS